MTAASSGPPAASAAERVRVAYTTRHQSDYIFSGPGLDIFLMIITCGIWGFYVFYQLMRRDRDGVLRRLELLDASTTFAWEQAERAGKSEELRPTFERVQANLAGLRAMTTEFRDPTIWLLLAIGGSFFGVGFVVYILGFVFIDGDLIKRDAASGAIEADLAQIYGALGVTLPTPDPSRVKGEHNYVGRVLASIFSCGLYTLWWVHNLMTEGNEALEASWPFEEALANGVQQLSSAA